MKVESKVGPRADRRVLLTRQRVLEAAVELADGHSLDSVSMRRLGQELGVEAMSLYTHVKSKEDLLAGMVEVVMGQIPTLPADGDWKRSLRQAVMAARGILLEHPWAPRIIEEQTEPGPAVMRHYDTVMGIMRNGGLSVELTHHALHLLGSRLLGFTQELFDDSPDIDADAAAALAQQLSATHPHVAEMALAVTHEGGLGGCDTDAEFEFSLDAILDSLERLRDAA